MDPQSGLDSRRRWVLPVLGGIVGVAALLIIALLFLRDDSDGAPEVSSSGTPGAELGGPSEASAASPSEGASESVAATPLPTAAGTAGLPVEWSIAATFSQPGQRYVFADMVSGTDGLVAIGTLYASEGRGVFGPPPAHKGVVWRSLDGTEWTETAPTAMFEQVELTHLFQDINGDFIAIGDTWIGTERTSAAWAAADGQTWDPIVLEGMPAGAWISRLVSGAQGFLAAAHAGAQSFVLSSADGRHWEQTLPNAIGVSDLGAGDEGFVASIFTGDGAPVIMASGDGEAWFAASPPHVDAFMVAPRDGDWLAMTSNFGDVVATATWQSANGLDWEALGELTLGTVGSPEVSCRESAAFLHGLQSMVLLGTALLGPCSEGAVVGAGGSYASLDGAAWSKLPFGDQATAAGAVQLDDRVIVATDTRTNRAPAIGVTFWISDAP